MWKRLGLSLMTDHSDHVLAMVYYDILIQKNIVEIIALMVE